MASYYCALQSLCVCSAPPLTRVSTSYLKYQTKCCDVTKHQCPANSLCVCVNVCQRKSLTEPFFLLCTLFFSSSIFLSLFAVSLPFQPPCLSRVFKLLNAGCSAQSIGLRDTAEKRERDRERDRALSQCLQMNMVPRARQTGSSLSISNPDSTISLTLQPSTHMHTWFFFHLESSLCEDTHTHTQLSKPIPTCK